MRPPFLLLFALFAASAVPQPSSLYDQAAALIQNSQPASAICILEARLHEAPQDLKALTLMGLALSADNRREDANRYFQQALDLNHSYAPALRNFALNEMALGDRD